jgi:uncharacterized membrane protein YhaH (DUF805 family)
VKSIKNNIFDKYNLLITTLNSDIMNWYLKVLKNYAGFSGRARRKEYWMFVLFYVITLVIAAILDNVLGTTFKFGEGETAMKLPYGYIQTLLILVFFIPSLAVGVRRLHDTRRSGWMMLLCLIPIVGGIWLLVLMLIEGTPGENEYGLNPKEQII